ncbi:MAG: biotin carboxyl carrier protein [Bacteroides sp. SM23_62]|nr:MAG: biotin carboxyl carrier protein [Bacteroides sp. SM23_62]
MSLEIRLDDRFSKVELVSKENNKLQIRVDDKLYELDMIKVQEGMYSILLEGKSYNIEIIEKDSAKQYSVNTLEKSYDLEIIDAETRYLMSRKGSDPEDAENIVSSPMPGKIVKIPVKAGEKVEAGQTVIIVSAMKMESEYKAGKEGVIREVHVSEGDTIEGHQPLVTIE